MAVVLPSVLFVGSNLGMLKEAKIGEGSRVAIFFPGFFADFNGWLGSLEGVGGVEKDGEGGTPREVVLEDEDEEEESLAYVRATRIVWVIIQGSRRGIIRAFCRRTKT
jgi:hypothetical protein